MWVVSKTENGVSTPIKVFDCKVKAEDWVAAAAYFEKEQCSLVEVEYKKDLTLMIPIKITKKSLDSFLRMLEEATEKKIQLKEREEVFDGKSVVEYREWTIDHPWWGKKTPVATGCWNRSENRWTYWIYIRPPMIEKE